MRAQAGYAMRYRNARVESCGVAARAPRRLNFPEKRVPVALFDFIITSSSRWELLNPDAEVVPLPIPRPIDGAAMSSAKL